MCIAPAYGVVLEGTKLLQQRISLHFLFLPQLIKDMVGVSESTNWSARSSAEAKYRALRCELQLLDPASLEYADVRDHVLNSQDE